MIVFSDQTINDGFGHFQTITAIMRDEEGLFSWMLRSSATVYLTNMLGQHIGSFIFLLHFWDDGHICIMKTDHPVNADIPYDDIIKLKEWCTSHGWKSLTVWRDLLDDPQSFEFWKRMYIAGLVQSDKLSKHESDEIERLSKISQIEENNDDQGQIYV